MKVTAKGAEDGEGASRRESNMAKPHSPRFLALVHDAMQRVREIDAAEVKRLMDGNGPLHLIDVREESEFAAGHLPRAIPLGKGILERDVEERFPDPNTPLILYCGGGYRSALAADNLQKMGYGNVLSMKGGYRGWREAGYPTQTE